jgi:hypothetical protein
LRASLPPWDCRRAQMGRGWPQKGQGEGWWWEGLRVGMGGRRVCGALVGALGDGFRKVLLVWGLRWCGVISD